MTGGKVVDTPKKRAQSDVPVVVGEESDDWFCRCCSVCAFTYTLPYPVLTFLEQGLTRCPNRFWVFRLSRNVWPQRPYPVLTFLQQGLKR